MRTDNKAFIDYLEKNPQKGSVLDLFPKKIKHGDIVVAPVEVSLLDSFRSARDGGTFFCPPGTYTRLTVKGKLWMSDTPMETRTQDRFIAAARGRVLVGGLGLGVVLRPLLAKPEVTAVIVVEINPDVIKIVGPKFADPRLVIMQGDVKDDGPIDVFAERGHTFDTIWLDVWPDINLDNEPEMKRLTAMWRRVLAPKGWIGCWGRVEAKKARK